MMTLYKSEAQIARMLGHDTAWLHKNATALERQYGFPPIDPAIGKRHAPSVEQWASERTASLRPAVRKKTIRNQENDSEF